MSCVVPKFKQGNSRLIKINLLKVELSQVQINLYINSDGYLHIQVCPVEMSWYKENVELVT